MSFVGLNFGKAGNVYADLLRQAHQEKIKNNQWEAQNRIQEQQAAYQYGLPVDEDMFIPSGMQDMHPADYDAFRRSQENMPRPPNGPMGGNYQPEQDPMMIPEQDLSRDPAQFKVHNIPAPPDRNSGQLIEKGSDITEEEVSKLNKILGPIRAQEIQDKLRNRNMFDTQIRDVYASSKSDGKGNIDPYSARRIAELQDMQLKSETGGGGGRSIADAALLAMLSKRSDTTYVPPPARRAAAREPRVSPAINVLQNQIKALENKIPKAFEAILNPMDPTEISKIRGKIDAMSNAVLAISSGTMSAEQAMSQFGLNPNYSPAPKAAPKAAPKGKVINGVRYETEADFKKAKKAGK